MAAHMENSGTEAFLSIDFSSILDSEYVEQAQLGIDVRKWGIVFNSTGEVIRNEEIAEILRMPPQRLDFFPAEVLRCMHGEVLGRLGLDVAVSKGGWVPFKAFKDEGLRLWVAKMHDRIFMRLRSSSITDSNLWAVMEIYNNSDQMFGFWRKGLTEAAMKDLYEHKNSPHIQMLGYLLRESRRRVAPVREATDDIPELGEPEDLEAHMDPVAEEVAAISSALEVVAAVSGTPGIGVVEGIAEPATVDGKGGGKSQEDVGADEIDPEGPATHRYGLRKSAVDYPDAWVGELLKSTVDPGPGFTGREVILDLKEAAQWGYDVATMGQCDGVDVLPQDGDDYNSKYVDEMERRLREMRNAVGALENLVGQSDERVSELQKSLVDKEAALKDKEAEVIAWRSLALTKRYHDTATKTAEEKQRWLSQAKRKVAEEPSLEPGKRFKICVRRSDFV